MNLDQDDLDELAAIVSGREDCPRCGGPRRCEDVEACPDCGRPWEGPPLVASLTSEGDRSR
jgi:uncharacterized protein (UPF0212 family)